LRAVANVPGEVGSITIEPIPAAGRSVLRNLLELYLHDFSKFDARDVDGQGLFGYRYLDH